MRIHLSVLVVSALSAVACEDGPSQPFSPAPVGAGARWNDGQNPGFSDPNAKQGYITNQNAGANAQEICSAAKKAARWSVMVNEPIVPPGKAAGVDGFGNTVTWPGLTLEQAEKINCQTEPSGVTYGDNDVVDQWGDNGEIEVKYNPDNHKITWWVLSNGYTGTLDFKSRDGKHTFQIQLGSLIKRDGQAYTLEWSNFAPDKSDPNKFDPASFPYRATEIADALFATFAPELKAEDIPTGTCITSGRCQQTIFAGSEGALRMYPLGLHLWVNNPSASQPVPSTPIRLDMRLPRIEPYTYAITTLKFDQQGPVATARGLGPNGADCVVELGTTWDAFLGNCVRTTGDPAKDATYFNKIVGSMTHDDERYYFNVTGVDVNVTSKTIGDTGLIVDNEQPAGNDVISSLYVDAATLGPVGNDYVLDPQSRTKAFKVDDGSAVKVKTDAEGTTFTLDAKGQLVPAATGTGKQFHDLHGAGYVYLEYARLVQEEINAQILLGNPNAVVHPLGDPACFGGSTAGDPATQYCTGFETFITPAAPLPAASTDPSAFNRIGADAAAFLGTLGLKPGSPSVAFCTSNTDPSSCGQVGPLFDTSFQQVISTLGHGDVSRLPSAIQDRRFFFKQYVTALTKLFRATQADGTLGIEDPSTCKVTPVADLAKVTLNTNDFFFDAEGGGQYEKGEYVDRPPPCRRGKGDAQVNDVEIVADILNGTVLSYQFFRNLYRGEETIYQALTTDPKDLQSPGVEDNGFITNIYGSPVLAAAFVDDDKPVTVRAPKVDPKTHKSDPCAPKSDPKAPTTTLTVQTAQTKASAYQCASANWTKRCNPAGLNGYLEWVDRCGGNLGPKVANPAYVDDTQNVPPYLPLMEDGHPLLSPYPGAFRPSAFALGGSSLTLVSTDISQGNAHIRVDFHQDPFDAKSPLTGSRTVSVPWAPRQPGFGWTYPLSGTRDELVQAAVADFTGTTQTGSLWYQEGRAKPDGTIPMLLQAVDSNDFLGDMFLCQSLADGSFLRAKMYAPVRPILDWLDAHPDAYANCGIFVRYSVFNNYPDFIISQLGGVTLDTTQGGGFGRVVNATLFVPGSY